MWQGMPDKIVSSEILQKHGGISLSSGGNHGIDARGLMALWVSGIPLSHDIIMELKPDISDAHLRIWLNGQLIADGDYRDRQQAPITQTFKKGKNRLEVEYTSHGDSNNLTLLLLPSMANTTKITSDQ